MKQGWEIKKMLDVVDFQRGLTYSKNDEVNFSDNIVLRSNNVDLKTNKLDFTELKYINPKIVVAENKKVTKGSLIICTANGSKSHLGKVALIDEDYGYAFGGFMGLIKPKENLNSNFLFHIMTSEEYKKFIGALSDGANINNLKFSDLGEFEIPLPPLTEQKRIVAILDEAFSAIAKAKANAEQNLKNVKELFESYKNELFDNKGKGYTEIALKEICDKITQGPNPKYDKNENEKFRVLKTKNIYDKNIFYEEADKVSENVFNTCLSSELKDGDVLLAIVGQGSINKCNVFENKTSFRFIYTRALGLIRTNKLKLNPYFLKAFLQSKRGKDLIDYGIGGTSGQQVVTTTHIKALKIPLPSLKDQQAIIQKLDILSIEVKKLEVIYQTKINDLEELKKSVLQKAFSGELKTSKALV
jgi:type I restriction enzyme S subunit